MKNGRIHEAIINTDVYGSVTSVLAVLNSYRGVPCKCMLKGLTVYTELVRGWCGFQGN